MIRNEFLIKHEDDFKNRLNRPFVIMDNELIECKSHSASFIEIPCDVRRISKTAFKNCRRLKEIFIPKQVIEIDGEAFRGLKLTSIVVENNSKNFAVINGCLYSKDYKKILYAFDYNNKINIMLDNVNVIGSCAFNEGLKNNEINLPKSIKSIGKAAFNKCLVTKINLPSTIEFISDNAFNECKKLKIINLNNCENYVLEGGILFNKDKTKIIWASPLLCRKVEIPYSVLHIAEYAFNNCDLIDELILLNPKLEISKFAFSNCTKLEKVTFSKESKIEYGAFYNCSKIDSECEKEILKVSKSAFSNVDLSIKKEKKKVEEDDEDDFDDFLSLLDDFDD